MWGKEGIVTPLCKLSYQENIARLQIELATKRSKYCTSFLGSICGSTSCGIKGAQFAPQCSLYSNNSTRILGLIALLHFARLCPKRTRAAYINRQVALNKCAEDFWSLCSFMMMIPTQCHLTVIVKIVGGVTVVI